MVRAVVTGSRSGDVVATVEVDGGGVARWAWRKGPWPVPPVVPDEEGRPMHPMDGERYVRRVPYAFANARTAVRLEDV